MAVSFDSQRDSQRDTRRRTLFASLGALLYSLVILLCFQLGYVLIDVTDLVMLFIGFWTGHIATVCFVYYHHRKQMVVPSMSMLLMVWAVIFVSIILYYTVEIRPAFMMAYLTILLFGVFRLPWRVFFGITLFTLASYAVTLFLFQQSGSRYWSPQLELIMGITFLAALSGFCILGREFSLLQERLTHSSQELTSALMKIKALAITDELTGLYNRRHLFDHLDKQRAIANREGSNFVLAFVDLDKFKSINDQFGHQIGDDVLRQFSDLLQESIREVDIVARYGGEEFVLLLNGVGIETAAVVVERIRCAVEGLQFSEQKLAMTISVGITEYRAPETAKETLDRADEFLSRAKQDGRNRVVQDLVHGNLETAE
ncbi:MAG: diguanylate cyclase (GGDEF)-like protein [Oleispira sp.]|jgi:diguanylate cyclase (GGDEF)-like protein